VLLFYQIVRLDATAEVPPIDSCSGRGIQWDREEYSTRQVVQSDVSCSAKFSALCQTLLTTGASLVQ
jgi:hypothetical protein